MYKLTLKKVLSTIDDAILRFILKKDDNAAFLVNAGISKKGDLPWEQLVQVQEVEDGGIIILTYSF